MKGSKTVSQNKIGLLYSDTMKHKQDLAQQEHDTNIPKNKTNYCTLITIYNSLFSLFLQSGIIVWGQTFAHTLSHSSQYKKLLKLLHINIPSSSHTSPIFKSLKLLKFHDIFQVKLSSFVNESIIKPSFYFSTSFH